MTQKRRSKVRPQTTPGDWRVEGGIVRVYGPERPSADANPEAYGMMPIERLSPEELVERYPETREGLRDTDEDDNGPDWDSPAATEAIVRGIIEEIEASPNVRASIAKLAAADAESAPAYLKAMAREIDAQHERAEGRVASAIAPDLTLILGELWTVRLAKMAEAAGQMPTQYLQTLLARAWTAMPRRSRGEG